MGLKMFGKRFCAYMIDVIIVTIFCTLLSFVFSLVGFENLFYRSLVFYAIGIAYFSIQESSSYQASLPQLKFTQVASGLSDLSSAQRKESRFPFCVRLPATCSVW